MEQELRFFLGANTPNGFYTLYDELYEGMETMAETAALTAGSRAGAAGRPAQRLYIIKGGPGCGKSSFMRRQAALARERGQTPEIILCSGDPGSLDALLLPEKGIIFADGTAPHVLEPRYPGAAEVYLNLGRYYDADALALKKTAVMQKTDAYRTKYALAYRWLKAAGSLFEAVRQAAATPEFIAKAEKRAKGIIKRELPRRAAFRGHIEKRFLGALCSLGFYELWDTAAALCPRVYELRDVMGISSWLLEPIAEAAAAAGLDVIVCPDPLFPERPEHVLIPSLGLGFLTSRPECPYRGCPFRRVRVSEMSGAGGLRALRRQAASLAESGAQALREANVLHEELERIYNPHVDFAGVYELAETFWD